MADIHDRRPVAHSLEMAREWLDPATLKECAEEMVMHQSEPSDVFEWFRMDRAIGNVRDEGATLIAPANPVPD